MSRPRVVIIGAGFGGLEAARALARAPVDVTIVDRHNYHCFQPLLYQVATAALSPAEIAWPIRGILRSQTNATTLMETVSGIDTHARLAHAGDLLIPYDYLVIATGATHSYFGHEEWATVAPGLKEIEDALTIRSDILLAYEEAEALGQGNEIIPFLTLVIVGGGPTGVEMAGAIAELARDSLRGDFRHINPRSSHIILTEAGPRILPALPENLSAYAHRALTNMGVEVMTSNPVTGCDEKGVDTAKGRIEARTIIWAAGVVASLAAKWLNVEADRAGRILVNPDLSVPGLSGVFAIGDTAAVLDPHGQPVPGIAPAAKQMGYYIGRLIGREVAGKSAPAPFRYRHQGDLATIGRKAAVVRLAHINLKGFFGWLFWSLAHIYFLIGLRNRFVVAFSWFWSYLTFQRGARLITAAPSHHVAEGASETTDERATPAGLQHSSPDGR